MFNKYLIYIPFMQSNDIHNLDSLKCRVFGVITRIIWSTFWLAAHGVLDERDG
jgi:hypothetical protein